MTTPDAPHPYFGNVCSGFGAPTICMICNRDMSDPIHREVERESSEQPHVTTPDVPGAALTDEEKAALVEALRYDRCEYGCAITYTEESVKYDLAPTVERIVAARLAERDAQLQAVRDLADEWEAVYDRWSGVSDGPQVGIFQAHATRLRAALAQPAADMCHNGHPFVPGETVDNDPPSPDWCNTCGEARQPAAADEEGPRG